MLFGIPVIASDFDLYKEIVENNNAGICVNYFDLEQIKKVFVDLMNHREILKKYSDCGIKAAKARYLWKNQAEILIKEYKTILYEK
jgi:glycosyltransferase involved in cell wall biosynthesis